jgi:hypothetical protein
MAPHGGAATGDAVLAQAAEALGLGVLGAAFLFGFRHGIDWDHIAAITDITSSQEERSASMLFGTIYALGHALVVFLIGSAAILIGANLPPAVDPIMERIVGATLVILGVFVFVSLIKHGREFRMRSRWMLIFSGTRSAYRKARGAIARPPGDVVPIAGSICTATPTPSTSTRRKVRPSPWPRTCRCRSGTTAITVDRDITITSIRSPTRS